MRGLVRIAPAVVLVALACSPSPSPVPYSPEEADQMERASGMAPPAGYRLSGLYLVEDYMKDREKANEKYQGKVVIVAGDIKAVATETDVGGRLDWIVEELGYDVTLAENEAIYLEVASAADKWPLGLPQHRAPRVRCYFAPMHASELNGLRKFIGDPWTSVLLRGTVTEQEDRVPHVIEMLGCRIEGRILRD